MDKIFNKIMRNGKNNQKFDKMDQIINKMDRNCQIN